MRFHCLLIASFLVIGIAACGGVEPEADSVSQGGTDSLVEESFDDLESEYRFQKCRFNRDCGPHAYCKRFRCKRIY